MDAVYMYFSGISSILFILFFNNNPHKLNVYIVEIA